MGHMSRGTKVSWIVSLGFYVLLLILFLPLWIVQTVKSLQPYTEYPLGEHITDDIVSDLNTTSDEVVIKATTFLADVYLKDRNETQKLVQSLGISVGILPTLLTGYIPSPTETGISQILIPINGVSQNLIPELNVDYQKYQELDKNLDQQQLLQSMSEAVHSILVGSRTNSQYLSDLIELFLKKNHAYEKLDGTSISALFPKEPITVSELEGILLLGNALQHGFGTSNQVVIDKIISYFSKEVYNSQFKLYQTYIFPIVIITSLIIIAASFLVFYYRDEPEIRTKFFPYLVQVFVSCYINCFWWVFSCAYKEVFHPYNNFYSEVFLVIGLCGLLSAINNRHFVMYNLFTIKKRVRKRVYYIPMIWHSLFCIFAIIPMILVFHSYDYWDDSWHPFVAVLITIFLFLAEDAFYIFSTRKFRNQFVDFHSNVRVFSMLIFTAYIPTIWTIFVCSASQLYVFAGAFAFFSCYTMSCYVLDVFTLPLLKIYCRNNDKKWLVDFEFVAQDVSLNNLDDILNCPELMESLLAYAKTLHCEENVLYLERFSKLKKQPTREGVLQLYEDFFRSKSTHQLNLSSSVRDAAKDALSKFNNVDHTDVSIDDVVLIFDRSQQEVKHLVKRNLLYGFRDTEGVKKWLREKNKETEALCQLRRLASGASGAEKTTNRYSTKMDDCEGSEELHRNDSIIVHEEDGPEKLEYR